MNENYGNFQGNFGNFIYGNFRGNFWQPIFDKYMKLQRKSGYFLGNFLKPPPGVANTPCKGWQLATFIRQLKSGRQENEQKT